MSTAHYVAVKVGDEYEIRRVDLPYQAQKAAWIAGGLLLGAIGLQRRGAAGLGLLAAGIGMSYCAWTGCNPLDALKKVAGEAGLEGSASHHHDDFAPPTQQAADSVDEAAMESFPASDPPARSGTSSAVK